MKAIASLSYFSHFLFIHARGLMRFRDRERGLTNRKIWVISKERLSCQKHLLTRDEPQPVVKTRAGKDDHFSTKNYCSSCGRN